MTDQERDRKIDELYTFMQNLKRFDRIPLEVGMAFRRRLADLTTGVAVSSKGVNSEDVTVNESGSSTYTVLDDPDLFLDITATDGTVYKIPAWTA